MHFCADRFHSEYLYHASFSVYKRNLHLSSCTIKPTCNLYPLQAINIIFEVWNKSPSQSALANPGLLISHDPTQEAISSPITKTKCDVCFYVNFAS